jgi:hypothetical protein
MATTWIEVMLSPVGTVKKSAPSWVYVQVTVWPATLDTPKFPQAVAADAGTAGTTRDEATLRPAPDRHAAAATAAARRTRRGDCASMRCLSPTFAKSADTGTTQF